MGARAGVLQSVGPDAELQAHGVVQDEGGGMRGDGGRGGVGGMIGRGMEAKGEGGV